MQFTFNAVELKKCVATINEKPWACAREVCRALEYGKATKAGDKEWRSGLLRKVTLFQAL